MHQVLRRYMKVRFTYLNSIVNIVIAHLNVIYECNISIVRAVTSGSCLKSSLCMSFCEYVCTIYLNN